ncbi:class IV adenylate cyclase [Candidatus Dependentiae bacterium]|nr:class IV adenylate cyclase [Candidatus Dependentiae bacterium]MBU4387034.1 class IV adenylate cyclase [Candidatus Dependentiae bacterium]MCG2756698.1 class IV adenylate cyclase [Candidatus Dependentiae bacterium]
MQKEIEIKLKLDKTNSEKLNLWLTENAKYINSLNITDYYFDNPKCSFYSMSKTGYKEALNFLRLRLSDKDNFICFKKREIDDSGKTLSVDEVETKVEDGFKVIEILKNSGFSEVIEIEKKREVFLYKNLFEFAIDNFDKHGEFIEIELKNYDGSALDGIEQIYNLLKAIKITKFVLFDRGYLTIFINPNYDFGKNINL